LAYDNVNEACSSVEKSIKLVETTLSNRFNSLTDQVNELSSKISETNQEVSGEAAMSDDQALTVSSGKALSQQSNLSRTFSSILSEEREKDKRRLNLILHNVPEPTNSNSNVRKQDDTDNAAAIFN